MVQHRGRYEDQTAASSQSADTPADERGRLLSALCQFERDLTVQRTNEGLKAARARGRKGGRPQKDKKIIDKALKLYDAKTHSISEICEVCGIAQGTLYNAIRKRKERMLEHGED